MSMSEARQSEAFFENARALVDQGVEAAIHDFVRRYLTLRNACFLRSTCE